MKPDTRCCLPELALMLDMSGMVSGCQDSTWWYEDRESPEHHMFTVHDDLKRVWKSPHRREFIQRLQNGERLSQCSICWNKEDAGVKSLRQIMNELYGHIEPHPDQPRVIIIKPGIQCNNACRSCNEITSTSWFKDAYEFDRDTGYNQPFKVWLKKYQPHVTSYKDNHKLEATFDDWQDDIVFWDLYGGEPLMIPLFYKILESSVASGAAKHQMFGCHTNGTIYKPQLVELFREFHEVSFAISIDGVGAKNDYLRYGSRYSEVVEVTNQYFNDMNPYSNIKLSVRCSPTILNVYDMPELWYEEQRHQWRVSYENYVTDQPHNNIQYIPYELKLKVAEKLAPIDRFSQVIKFLMSEPPNYTRENQLAFWHHNNKLDQLRNESFANTFPEWHELWYRWIKNNT